MIACFGSALRAIGLVTLSLLLTLTAANAERRVALVLGNSQYQHAPALTNPVRDAQAVADRLEKLDFEVVSGFDLTKLQTQTTIAQFAKQVRGADIALFFYAGHGLQVSGSNYLLPVDAALEDETSLDFE
ncbi:MAG: peptidase c14 caspase catalytic subunit p20, partial [Mesorhizobium sp.]